MLKPRGLNICIGFDQREAISYHTLCHSILARSSIPVRFLPVKRTLLAEYHNRPLDDTQSNEFSYTRYLTPFLSDYEGVSLFLDCDMLVRCDIAEILKYWHPTYYVSVVKHDYTPKDSVKYLGNVQHAYPRKNWSSVMLFNNNLCRKLTPDYVEKATPKELHRFEWCPDDRIGELPIEFNHLVREYQPNPDAKIVHWTVGGPWFNEYQNSEFSDEWYDECALMRMAQQIDFKQKTSHSNR